MEVGRGSEVNEGRRRWRSNKRGFLTGSYGFGIRLLLRHAWGIGCLHSIRNCTDSSQLSC